MSDIENPLDRLSPAEKRALLTKVLRKKSERTYPLSFAQERLWFLDQLQPGSPAYNIPSALPWPAPLNVKALRRSLDEIVRRHQTLRTVFRMEETGPVQVVTGSTELDLREIDVRDMPESTRPEEARRLAAQDAQELFDLAKGPLFRASVVRLSDADYLLLFNMHHIVSDGWSMGIFYKELRILYQAFSANRPSPLPELPIQYTDFVAWQRKHLQGEVLESHLAYWKHTLEGCPLVAELPSDRPRPAVQSYRGAWQTFVVSKAVREKLKRIGQSEEATLFMTLLAAFKLLLHRYSGRNDLIVGTPIANRDRAEIEPLIGFFVNTLVLRIDLSGEPSFRQLLGRVRGTALPAFAHQDLPFEKLVEELQPERTMSHHPVVQVVFALQNLPTLAPPPGARERPGPPRQAAEVPAQGFGTAKFDLSLLMEEIEDGLAASFEYAIDLFDHETVGRMIGHFRTLLADVVENPDRKISELGLLTDSERRFLVECNRTERSYDTARYVHHEIAARAAQCPHAVAVVAERQKLTYAELDRQANRLAWHLLRLGVEPQARVGVCLEPSIDLPVAILAILKTGAAYVPLDPAQPQKRFARIARDAGMSLLLSHGKTAERLRHELDRPSVLDLSRGDFENESDADPQVAVTSENTIYVIYTSGSTGLPKGAAVQHGGFLNLMRWFLQELGMTEADDVLMASAIGFDLTQKNLFAPLMTGGRLHLSSSPHFDPRLIVERIDQAGITIVNCTPTAAYALVEATEEVHQVRSLRHLVLGGEPIHVRRLWKWLGCSAFGGEVTNTYGPTECTDVCSYYRLAEKEALLESPVPIGRPVANTQLHVLDRYLRPAPVGVPGELWIGGAGVSRGYVDDPRMTADRFLPDAFSASAGARLYRSGDLARRLGDGDVEYLGRADHQVKIRGFRIELGEIEAEIRRHAAVADAVVVERDYAEADRRLLAYVVPDREIAGPVAERVRLERVGGLDGHQCIELPNGMSVVHMNRSETEFLFREIFEEETYLKNGVVLRDGDCVFDVGANIGMFDLFVAKVCREARIFAFEPIPPLLEAARLNSRIYGVDVTTFAVGLARRSGTASFTYYPHVSILSGRFADPAKEQETVRVFLRTQQEYGLVDPSLATDDLEEMIESRLVHEVYECPLKTLSQVIRENEVETIDLLKVDVEKAELDVLEGIDDVDWPRIRQVVIEVHDLDGQLQRVTALLESHGFHVTVDRDWLLGGTGIYNVYARAGKQERTGEARSSQTPAPWRWASRERYVSDLERSLRESLPEYMLPFATVLMDKMPLSPNGKVDRLALPAPEEVDRPKSTYVAPRDPVEETLAGIWTQILGAERVGVDQNFFKIGGHSLSATQMVSRVRKAFEIDLSVRHTFEAPTIELLAGVIKKSLSTLQPPDTSPDAGGRQGEEHRVPASEPGPAL